MGAWLARLSFPLQVTAPQWSQRAEQAENDEVQESSIGCLLGQDEAGDASRKVLLTAAVAMTAHFRMGQRSRPLRHVPDNP